MSSPAFHAGNVLLHAGVALAVFGFAREFLTEAAGLPPDRARRVGAWAGALFAVHPLCSEIPNYVRARDIALVSLFTVLTAWAVLRWRRRGGWRWLAAALAALLAATFSKEVGIVVAGGTAVLAWVGVSRPEPPPRREGSPGWLAFPVPLAFYVGGTLGLMTVIALSRSIIFYLSPLWNTVSKSLAGPRMGWHLLTQARVFWMYGWRVFLPIRLCSDHQIAWTVSLDDPIAWLSTAGLVTVLAVTAGLWFRARTRPLALLLTLAWLAILHRLADVSSELMVEYRIYPAMVFLCIALAWGLDSLLTRLKIDWARPALLASLLVACTVLSMLRTRDWRSPETLAANVIAQYPLQARARQEVQEADIRAGHWQSVLARREGIIRALDAMAAFSQSQPVRRYDYSLAVLTRVSTEGNYAQGLVHTGHGGAAFAHLSQLMEDLRENGLTEAIYWSTGLLCPRDGPRGPGPDCGRGERSAPQRGAGPVLQRSAKGVATDRSPGEKVTAAFAGQPSFPCERSPFFSPCRCCS